MLYFLYILNGIEIFDKFNPGVWKKKNKQEEKQNEFLGFFEICYTVQNVLKAIKLLKLVFFYSLKLALVSF